MTRNGSLKFIRLLRLSLILVVITVVASSCTKAKTSNCSGKIDSIVVAYSPFEQNALLWIAQNQNLFKKNCLKVTLRKYDTGAGSLDGMLKGEADIVTGVTEFPTVGRALKKEKIRILGSLAKIEQIHIIGRKDRGIEQFSDLKGKKVGTTVGTVAHFYLGRFLELNGMSMKDITLVDVKTPEEWVNAVAVGKIDAIATAQPFANKAKERLGANAVFWRAQGEQLIFGLVISTDSWTETHPETVKRFLESLSQAEDFAVRNPAKAKAVLQKELNVGTADIKRIWSQDQFSLSLDQSLILAMEDEARWMIKNNLTTEKQVPVFTDYIYQNGLKTVKGEAVNIIR